MKVNSLEDLLFIDDIVRVWTDGSAELKTKLGGIGVYIRYKNHEKKISIGYKNTKTGRCEIKAVIVALNQIKDTSKEIIVYSDSQYVVKSINEWMKGWESKAWVGVKNLDLWKLFLQIYSRFDKSKITFVWTRGHTKSEDYISIGNEIADQLACYKSHEVYLESDLIL